MISVLIPVYNYQVFNLVESIHTQLLLLKIEFEIICVDDASIEYVDENKIIEKFNNTFIFSLKNNVGRSKIRNLLVEKSIYNWLLFLDADVLPQNNNFLINYIHFIKINSHKVYFGGVVYENNKPNKDKLLRWVYGKEREEINLNIREQNPYQYFSGANFLINKSVFTSIKFNESIVKYGYEDVLFVDDLRRSYIEVKQINNAVFHLGVEENSKFLSKTKEAIQNLIYLNSEKIVDWKSIKILRTYEKIKLYRLTWVFSLIYIVFNKILEWNLKSKSPSMQIFDVYKLTYLCYISRK